MEIDVTEEGLMRLQEVFNPIILETSEGQTFGICMREDGIEVTMVNKLVKRDGSNEVYKKTFYLTHMQCIDLAEQAKASELSVLPNVGLPGTAQSEVYDRFQDKDFEGIAL